VHPFVDGVVLSSFAEWAHTQPVRNRAEALRAILGDLLPDDIIGRRTKATFDGAFWTRHAREFALSLSPEDLDSELVDGPAAIEYWRSEAGDPYAPVPSATLLQSIWLQRRAPSPVDDGEQRVDGLADGVPVARPAQL
jgi:asparagine synthase (glutamine-hydrolysing)